MVGPSDTDRLAFASPQGQRTFEAVNRNANRLARALRRRGLREGDAVAPVPAAKRERVAVRSGLGIGVADPGPVHLGVPATEPDQLVVGPGLG